MTSKKKVQNCTLRIAVCTGSIGLASPALAQVPQEPIGAVLRYEVALPGDAWGSSAAISSGQRVEWRAVLSYTGTSVIANALGSIFYQPVLSNVDNTGSDAAIDQLGTWRNNGISGQGNTSLAQGLLSLAEGADSSSLASYGRVRFGFTSRSTNAGNSGGLTAHRHTDGSNDAPAGSHMRIAGINNPNWYPSSIPNGSIALNNQILWGVVSDNPAETSTWFVAGTQDLVLFRQAFIASDDTAFRQVSIFSEAATLFRTGGSTGTDDTRYMRWNGDPVTMPLVRTGVEYVPATIQINFPAPAATSLAALAALFTCRRRRNA